MTTNDSIQGKKEVKCNKCNFLFSPEDLHHCKGCRAFCCEECSTRCKQCGKFCCTYCIDNDILDLVECGNCGELYCERCIERGDLYLTECEGCELSYCEYCIKNRSLFLVCGRCGAGDNLCGKFCDMGVKYHDYFGGYLCEGCVEEYLEDPIYF